ncbi:hypothetical protein [Geomesophilobacter sediminis]|uniref:Cytochrome C n=1 Tax=Geomesophilobacter sediminis TaxID=2798584 RepID=A0A8J7JDX5_9BACT|nr:hypothetical protein [Geomesophilobacter sediminis]MBJ6725483.1 hypothetical protein [Geomesophilobacter sediminis]
MFKKSLASALLVCTVPAMASGAWFLTTKVTSVGGTLRYDYQGASAFQSYSSGAKTKSFDAYNAATVSVAADTHNTIKSVTITKVDKDGTQTVNTQTGSSVSINPADGDNFTVWANFQVDPVTARASVTNGSVSPSSIGNLYYGYKVMSDLTFSFTPKVGYTMGAISGAPTDSLVVVSNASKADQRATVTFKKGYVFTGPVALSAAAAAPANRPSLSTGAPQNVAAGNSQGVSLTATTANVGAVTWYYVSGPQNAVAYNTVAGKVIATVTPAPSVSGFTDQNDTNNTGVAGGNIQKVFTGPTASSVTVSFPAGAAAGQYKFLARATGTDNKIYNSIATVNVLAHASDVGTQCQSCHTANNIRTVADTSSHASCQACHFVDAGHPGAVNAGSVNAASFTVNVDNVANGNGTAAAQGTNFCASCHSAGNAAQAIPTLTTHQNKVCSACHASAHETHVVSATCQVCHATVNDHTAATMGTKGCTDCHDGHNPTVATKPFEVAAATHPPVVLYTFEEIGMQMAGGQKVPVQVDASGKGMPYSPKQTCGTSGCHVINGVDYSYDKISDHAFHSNQGRSEYTDTANGKFDATKNKPWTQSTAMVGKW